jgi:hypothetical protein
LSNWREQGNRRPVNDFAVEQRAKGDPNELADTIEALREDISGSVGVKHRGDH